VTTSAVSAVVIGFALQDTLGNAFAGLAIQSEKPFHVGQWVKVGDHEGRVAEVTWRATKLRTKSGNFVILPNNIVAKEAIVNYSEPAAPMRLEVEVGASYLVPPNKVKAAMMEALRHSSRVLPAPAPTCCSSRSTLRDQLPRRASGSRTTSRRGGARRSPHRDLLRVPAARHRDPVADPGAVRTDWVEPTRCGRA
jgi:small-conductance mechanosensitive channel